MNRILDQIAEEINGVIAKMDERDLVNAMGVIGRNDRVYATGEGRSGFQARAFAMRMMHIGYTSYMMGETICPSMHEGDVLVAISGSGKTKHTVEDAEAAKKLGVKVIAVTSKPESPLADVADAVIVVPGRVKGEAGGSVQLLSSLFDQSVHIALDALCLRRRRERQPCQRGVVGRRRLYDVWVPWTSAGSRHPNVFMHRTVLRPLRGNWGVSGVSRWLAGWSQ